MKTLMQEGAFEVVLLEGTEVESLIEVFEEISVEQGWQPQDQLRAYPNSSTYFGLLHEDKIIGGLQLVVAGTPEGLPCLTAWPELNISNSSQADIALLAITKPHRGNPLLFWYLCIEMWRFCKQHHISELWIEATEKKQRLYRRFGWPLEVGGEIRLHWGEACNPCHMCVEAIDSEMKLRARKASLYARIVSLMYRNVLS